MRNAIVTVASLVAIAVLAAVHLTQGTADTDVFDVLDRKSVV